MVAPGYIDKTECDGQLCALEFRAYPVAAVRVCREGQYITAPSEFAPGCEHVASVRSTWWIRGCDECDGCDDSRVVVGGGRGEDVISVSKDG